MRNRGRHWSAIDYVALDFETTGLDPDVDQVISMGAVPVISGRVELSLRVYGETSHSRPPDRSAVPVHGLRPADLRDSPSRGELEAVLAAALRGRRIVAWAAWVESVFLASMYGESGRAWHARIVDVRDLVAHVDRLSGMEASPEESLVAASARYGIPPARAHHALGDALMTAELFLVAAKRLERLGVGRARDLLELGSGRGS